jgi:two-component system response regulator AlgR
MKILIADDEALARSRLIDLIGELGAPFEVIGEAKNGREALLGAERLLPDVVLLDIRMPVMDGIEAARELAKLDSPPALIFTTAFEEHAVEAFEVSALDYLLKPIRKKRLEVSLRKAEVFNRARWEKLQEQLPEAQKRRSKICVKIRNDLQLVAVDEICFFRAGEKYVTIFDAHHEWLIEESLKSLENEFCGEFIRVHRNALVARLKVIGLEKSSEGHYFIRLSGCNEKVEVSRRHLPEVRALIATSIA